MGKEEGDVEGTSDGAEAGGWYDSRAMGMDQMMVPLPLRIRKKSRAITDSGAMVTEIADDNIEEPPGEDHQYGCYWQSDSWQRFKDMGYSSMASSAVGPSRICSVHIETEDDKPGFVGIDLEPLKRVRKGICADEEFSNCVEAVGRGSSETALGALIDEVKAMQEVDFLVHGIGRVACGNTTQRPPRRNPSNHMSWYIRLLSDIENHQNIIDLASAASPGTPHILSNSLLTSLWIRERMRGKWREMYKVILAPQRAEMRLRMREAGNAADRQGVVAEKGCLMRQALKKVVASELSDIAHALRQSLEAPAREIDSLYALLLAQQHLVLRNHTSLPHLISIQDQHQTSLARALNHTTPSLLAQLDAIDSLLDIGFRTIVSMTTRVNRVGAKDVRDVEEREREVKRRWENPGVVLGYLGKVGEDLGFLRLWGRTVEVGFKDVEEELAGFAERVVDLFVTEEACVLLAEGQ